MIDPSEKLIFLLLGMIIVVILIGIASILTSCTISFQNISTHGTATDLVDENQAASPEVQTKISPIIPKM